MISKSVIVVVIAVIMVLIALIVFFLGPSPITRAYYQTKCTSPSSVYQCANASYNHKTGQLMFTFTQHSGSAWYNVKFGFANSTQISSFLSGGFNITPAIPATALNTSLGSNTPNVVSLPVQGSPSIGSILQGYIVATYIAPTPKGALYRINIAAVNLTVT